MNTFMNMLANKIAENHNDIAASIVVEGNLVAELEFASYDITYADDGTIYIRYDGTDITIPTEDATLFYDEDYDTFEINIGVMTVSIIF